MLGKLYQILQDERGAVVLEALPLMMAAGFGLACATAHGLAHHHLAQTLGVTPDAWAGGLDPGVAGAGAAVPVVAGVMRQQKEIKNLVFDQRVGRNTKIFNVNTLKLERIKKESNTFAIKKYNENKPEQKTRIVGIALEKTKTGTAIYIPEEYEELLKYLTPESMIILSGVLTLYLYSAKNQELEEGIYLKTSLREICRTCGWKPNGGRVFKEIYKTLELLHFLHIKNITVSCLEETINKEGKTLKEIKELTIKCANIIYDLEANFFTDSQKDPGKKTTIRDATIKLALTPTLAKSITSKAPKSIIPISAFRSIFSSKSLRRRQKYIVNMMFYLASCDNRQHKLSFNWQTLAEKACLIESKPTKRRNIIKQLLDDIKNTGVIDYTANGEKYEIVLLFHTFLPAGEKLMQK
ncbi:MAG: hypothetical protein K6T65_08785 [Peptococcaceae bacterium]|nr:hypothetical protein [Peptococcaceae bacterium]